MNQRAVLDYLDAWAQANSQAQDELAGWSLFECRKASGECVAVVTSSPLK
ncbi:hypothetical protein [Coleofasciculus sp. FACHB-SPT36]|nr:hypothetical protein [Coleofasciculus sp. FACHB-SPT36]